MSYKPEEAGALLDQTASADPPPAADRAAEGAHFATGRDVCPNTRRRPQSWYLGALLARTGGTGARRGTRDRVGLAGAAWPPSGGCPTTLTGDLAIIETEGQR